MTTTLIREPEQSAGIAPLKILLRSDQRHIVYSPSLPFGGRTAFEGTCEACCAEAVRLAGAAR